MGSQRAESSGCQAPPAELRTHLQQRPPTALAFPPRDAPLGDAPPRLCVGARDCVVLWDLGDVWASAESGAAPLEPLELAAGQGHVDALALTGDASAAAVCVG